MKTNRLKLSCIDTRRRPFWRKSAIARKITFQGLDRKRAMADQPLPSKAMPAAVKPKAKPPPAALQRQMLNASARWDDNSSVSSWVRLEEETSAAALSQTLDGVSQEADRPTDQEAHQPKGPCGEHSTTASSTSVECCTSTSTTCRSSSTSSSKALLIMLMSSCISQAEEAARSGSSPWTKSLQAGPDDTCRSCKESPQ